MVSTHLKNISQIGNLPQIGVTIKNIWNHQPGIYIYINAYIYIYIIHVTSIVPIIKHTHTQKKPPTSYPSTSLPTPQQKTLENQGAKPNCLSVFHVLMVPFSPRSPNACFLVKASTATTGSNNKISTFQVHSIRSQTSSSFSLGWSRWNNHFKGSFNIISPCIWVRLPFSTKVRQDQFSAWPLFSTKMLNGPRSVIMTGQPTPSVTNPLQK